MPLQEAGAPTLQSLNMFESTSSRFVKAGLCEPKRRVTYTFPWNPFPSSSSHTGDTLRRKKRPGQDSFRKLYAEPNGDHWVDCYWLSELDCADLVVYRRCGQRRWGRRRASRSRSTSPCSGSSGRSTSTPSVSPRPDSALPTPMGPC